MSRIMYSPISIPVALSALLGLSSAAGLIQVEVRYSKNMIDVGDLDVFDATWQTIYGLDGNGRAVTSDLAYQTFGDQCTHHTSGPENNVQVQIGGRWGQVSGLGLHDSREALVTSLYEVLDRVAEPTGWNVFTNCYGTTWQEGVPRWTGQYACGGPEATVRSECMCAIGSASCEKHSWGHRVPSIITANLYRDGMLLPDQLTISFGASKIAKDEGCGLIGSITGALVGFLPGPGAVFATGIDVFCG